MKTRAALVPGDLCRVIIYGALWDAPHTLDSFQTTHRTCLAGVELCDIVIVLSTHTDVYDVERPIDSCLIMNDRGHIGWVYANCMVPA